MKSINLEAVVGSQGYLGFTAQVNGMRDRGLLDLAVHPDFENNPYVYLLFTYDPPEVYQNASHPLAGPDRNLYYVDLDDGQIGRWVFV